MYERAPLMGTHGPRLAKETNEMSEPILVDFSIPFKATTSLDMPKGCNGLIVHWGDHDEFIPDSDEITNDE